MSHKIITSIVAGWMGLCLANSAVASSNTVNVMTYNVHYGVNAGKTNTGADSALDQLVSGIKEKDIDICFVQEFPHGNSYFKFTGVRANPRAFIESMLPKEYTVYEEVVRDGTTQYGKGKSQLIITRLPKIGGPYVKDFPTPMNDMTRQIALLKLEVAGKPLWVGNTHPWHKYDELHESDLDTIVQFIKSKVPAEDAIIWGGDLNFEGKKYGDKYRKFTKQGFKDAYAAATGKYAEAEFYNTFVVDRDPGTCRIDYLFYRNVDSCGNYWRAESEASDHFAIGATFTLGTECDSSDIQQAEDSATLKVLIWNILHAGNDVKEGPEKILALIRRTGADICLLQESYDIDGDRPMAGAWLAGELGWNQFQGASSHLCVLTHFPILEDYFYSSGHGIGARLDLDEGREVVAYSTWIDYRSTIWWHLHNDPGISDEDLLKCETELSSRYAQTQGIIGHLKTEGHLDGSRPLLVGGDWNCPSHLDWVEEAEAAMPLSRRALPLPSSLEMESTGFTDSFRAVHPDPLTVQGNTWSPMYQDTPPNRIDRLYVKNPASGFALIPVAATVFPEEDEYEDNSIPIDQREFPSDHAAVLVEFRIVEQSE